MSAIRIAMLNMKGGVGKTTLAVNLAWHLFKAGKHRVLLIDLDPQFNASQYLMDYESYANHVATQGTIATLLIDQPDLAIKKKKSKKSIKSSIVKIDEGDQGSVFDFLPSQLALAHVVKNPAQMDYKLEKLIEPVQDNYDCIIIDCAPTDSVLTTMALNASNFILAPMRPDRFSVLGFANLIDTVNRFRDNASNPNNVRELGIVFTQVRGDSSVETECMKNVRKEAGRSSFYVFDSELGFSNTFIRAVQDQTPVFETKWARDDLKDNVNAIVDELKNRISELLQDSEEE